MDRFDIKPFLLESRVKYRDSILDESLTATQIASKKNKKGRRWWPGMGNPDYVNYSTQECVTLYGEFSRIKDQLLRVHPEWITNRIAEKKAWAIIKRDNPAIGTGVENCNIQSLEQLQRKAEKGKLKPRSLEEGIYGYDSDDFIPFEDVQPNMVAVDQDGERFRVVEKLDGNRVRCSLEDDPRDIETVKYGNIVMCHYSDQTEEN